MKILTKSYLGTLLIFILANPGFVNAFPSFPPRPTLVPTTAPSQTPTAFGPTHSPTILPTFYPSAHPTADPLKEPTIPPSNLTEDPTLEPTSDPTTEPTLPTSAPTNAEEQVMSPTNSVKPPPDSMMANVDDDSWDRNTLLTVIYILSAVCAALIICIIGYVVYKCWRRRQKKMSETSIKTDATSSSIQMTPNMTHAMHVHAQSAPNMKGMYLSTHYHRTQHHSNPPISYHRAHRSHGEVHIRLPPVPTVKPRPHTIGGIMDNGNGVILEEAPDSNSTAPVIIDDTASSNMDDVDSNDQMAFWDYAQTVGHPNNHHHITEDMYKKPRAVTSVSDSDSELMRRFDIGNDGNAVFNGKTLRSKLGEIVYDDESEDNMDEDDRPKRLPLEPVVSVKTNVQSEGHESRKVTLLQHAISRDLHIVLDEEKEDSDCSESESESLSIDEFVVLDTDQGVQHHVVRDHVDHLQTGSKLTGTSTATMRLPQKKVTKGQWM